MINLSMLCTMTILFLGVCAMLGVVINRYQRLHDAHVQLKESLKAREEEIA